MWLYVHDLLIRASLEFSFRLEKFVRCLLHTAARDAKPWLSAGNETEPVTFSQYVVQANFSFLNTTMIQT